MSTILKSGEATVNIKSSSRMLAAFFGATCLVCFWVYRGALHGPFISDDSFFVVDLANNYPLDWQFVALVFDPLGDLKYEMMAYAPLYLLTSRIEWEVFGASTFGYHVVNVMFHALNATLLVALMRREGIDTIWALIGGAFIAFHPANVEAVGWISQLRSILAVTCALGSLLALRNRPGLSAALFAAGLLFKISAVFVLPIAFVLYWCSRSDPQRESISLAWLCVWVSAFALCAYPAYDSTSLATDPRSENLPELLRSIGANASRYAVMATTSIGVSAFHTPAPVRSWSNSWWLASLPLGLILFWRIVDGIVRRRDETAWWIGAGTAFVMISQYFPFYFTLADRYLYFILPGLLVASLLWWQELKIVAARRYESIQPYLSRIDAGLRVASVLLLTFFAIHSSERAGLWQNELRLLADSATNYPRGGPAYWLRSMIALEKGDIDTGIRELRGVVDTDYFRYVDVFGLPMLAPYMDDRRIVRLRHRIARLTIEMFDGRSTTQHQMRSVASSYFYIGQYDAAISRLKAALRRGGPHRDAIFDDLDLIREAKRDRQAADLP